MSRPRRAYAMHPDTGKPYICGFCGEPAAPLNYHEGPEDCAVARSEPELPNDYMEGGTHYRDMGVQPWQALEAWLTPEQFKGFLLGTATAYLARFNASAPGKGGVLDIRKARHTLAKLVEVCEKAKVA